MEIDNFYRQDLPAAAALTYSVWHDELAEESRKLQSFVYEAMTRYYFRSSSFSFKITEDGLMRGFLLAAQPSDKDCSRLWFRQNVAAFPARERRVAERYMEYLSFNGRQLERYISEDTLLLWLFLSRKAGGGSRLLRRVEMAARAAGLGKMLLWADETCDAGYYHKKGFYLAGKFINDKLLQLGSQKTMVFLKAIK